MLRSIASEDLNEKEVDPFEEDKDQATSSIDGTHKSAKINTNTKIELHTSSKREIDDMITKMLETRIGYRKSRINLAAQVLLVFSFQIALFTGIY